MPQKETSEGWMKMASAFPVPQDPGRQCLVLSFTTPAASPPARATSGGGVPLLGSGGGYVRVRFKYSFFSFHRSMFDVPGHLTQQGVRNNKHEHSKASVASPLCPVLGPIMLPSMNCSHSAPGLRTPSTNTEPCYIRERKAGDKQERAGFLWFVY